MPLADSSKRNRDSGQAIRSHRHAAWFGTWILVILAISLLGAFRAIAIAGETPATPPPDTQNVAGVVIDFGDGRVTYALVSFVEDEISGYELLERSEVSLLAISFGGLGQGVCAIEAVGCDVSECRARMCQTSDPASPFWQYAMLDDGGEWRRSPLGASGSRVSDGDINAWAWSDVAPEPDVMSLDEIATILDTSPDAARASGDPSPIVVTIGASDVSDEEGSARELALAATITAAIVVAGSFAVLRSRRGAS